MTDLSLYAKISSLPDPLKSEVIDFIDFISARRIKAQKKAKKTRTFGYAKDSVRIKPGFDDPIDDFKEYM
jgi:hypothetical protein